MSEEELNKITWEEYKRLIEESEIIYNELQEATKEIERLNNIIKEVREYIENTHYYSEVINEEYLLKEELLKILDKEGK